MASIMAASWPFGVNTVSFSISGPSAANSGPVAVSPHASASTSFVPHRAESRFVCATTRPSFASTSPRTSCSAGRLACRLFIGRKING
jgi:hypothetical protein